METTKWTVDPTHSEIGFKVKHMMFTTVSGKFDTYEASITTQGDDLENAQAEFSADAKSINTGNTDRDNHLRSADFFNSEESPKVTFRSNSITRKGDAYEMTGDLTINGRTNQVTLPVEYSGKLADPWGNTKIAMTITGKINRKDWGINWNSALETGGVLVSDEVKFDIELQFVKQQ